MTSPLLSPLLGWADVDPSRPLLAYPGLAAQQPWVSVCAAELTEQVRALSLALLATGLTPGDRVVVFAPTCVEFTMLDLACLLVGIVVVPAYESSSPSQLSWIISDSGASAVFAAPSLVPVLESALESTSLAHPAVRGQLSATGLDSLRRSAPTLHASLAVTALDGYIREVGPSSLATIVYTSGTTGRPKGCELTHAALAAEADAVASSAPEVFHEPSRTLLFLPLAHVFARAVQFTCLSAGAQVAFSSPDHLAEHMRSFEPTFLLAVPRVLEKLVASARKKAATSPARLHLFDSALSAARLTSSLRAQGARVPLPLRARLLLADKLVLSRLRSALGGQCSFIVCGGAALPFSVAAVFDAAGVQVLEGYGLTETSAAVCLNTPSHSRLGSVGRPLPGVALRLGDSCELLVQGPMLFSGYRHRPDATGEVLQGDWFSTGDLARIDADGFVFITGRSKDILVTAGGKNVAPEPLEQALCSSPVISQAVVLGEGRAFISCLLTLDYPACRALLGSHGLGLSDEQIAASPAILDAVVAALAFANESVSKAESVRTFAICPGEWTLASGHLTPSLKLRRSVVMDEYAELVEGMYAPRQGS